MEKLKEEIRAERLEKKIAKLGGTTSDITKRNKTKHSRDESDSDDDDNDGKNGAGLLVVKQVHEWGNKAQPLPEFHLNEASKSRHAKKIRIDGSSTGANHKIVFDDDGDVEDDMVHVEKAASSDGKELASAKEEYLQRVRDRLTKTKELDRQEEKDRIQEKHKKRRNDAIAC